MRHAIYVRKLAPRRHVVRGICTGDEWEVSSLVAANYRAGSTVLLISLDGEPMQSIVGKAPPALSRRP